MSTTISEVVVPSLERMLSDVQTEHTHWATLTTGTLEIAKSHVRLEDKVDKKFDQIDKRFDAVDRRFDEVDRKFDAVDKRFDEVDQKFDQVDKRLGIIEDDMRFVRSHVEQIARWITEPERPKSQPDVAAE